VTVKEEEENNDLTGKRRNRRSRTGGRNRRRSTLIPWRFHDHDTTRHSRRFSRRWFVTVRSHAPALRFWSIVNMSSR